jgi:hypothetical protein
MALPDSCHSVDGSVASGSVSPLTQGHCSEGVVRCKHVRWQFLLRRRAMTAAVAHQARAHTQGPGELDTPFSSVLLSSTGEAEDAAKGPIPR